MTPEEFRAALRTAVRVATNVTYHINITPEEARQIQGLSRVVNHEDASWFSRMMEAAIKKQESLGFNVDITPEQEKKIQLLTRFLQDQSEWSSIVDHATNYREED